MTRPAHLGEKGFSVVELLLAVGLLATVVLSLAASSLYTSRLLERSRRELGASKFLQTEIERLMALPYDSLVNGSRTLPEGTSSWTVSDIGIHREIVLISHYTPAAKVSVWDTVAAYRRAP